jgi:hypothetical protein
MSMIAYIRAASQEEVATLAADPARLDAIMFKSDGKTIDFDKAWHALHFMLTGDSGRTDHPASILLTDDDHLHGADEMGFGGYWLIAPDQVKAFAGQLASSQTINWPLGSIQLRWSLITSICPTFLPRRGPTRCPTSCRACRRCARSRSKLRMKMPILSAA